MALPLQAAGLRCGVVAESQDWNKEDPHGDLSALGREMCRAVSVALSNTDSIDVQSYATEQEALIGVQKGRSQLVAGVTPGARNAAAFGVAFSMPFFQDALGFLVHRSAGIAGLGDLGGRKLCFIDNTEPAAIALAVLAARHVPAIPFAFQEQGEMDAAAMDRHCEATVALVSKLAEARAGFRDRASFVFLPERLALVPVSVAVPARETRLRAVVDYTISALLQAELLGVSQASDPNRQSGDPRVRSLLGDDFATGVALGLEHHWARNVVKATGNYDTIFERAVGKNTPYDLERGANALWSRQGTMVPLPIQ